MQAGLTDLAEMLRPIAALLRWLRNEPPDWPSFSWEALAFGIVAVGFAAYVWWDSRD